MNAAAFAAGQVKQWSGQRRRYGENGQDMAASQRSNACSPILKRSARLVRAMRHTVENDGFGTARSDSRIRQDKNRSSADIKPACPRGDRHAPLNDGAGEVADERSLSRSIDP